MSVGWWEVSEGFVRSVDEWICKKGILRGLEVLEEQVYPDSNQQQRVRGRFE